MATRFCDFELSVRCNVSSFLLCYNATSSFVFVVAPFIVSAIFDDRLSSSICNGREFRCCCALLSMAFVIIPPLLPLPTVNGPDNDVCVDNGDADGIVWDDTKPIDDGTHVEFVFKLWLPLDFAELTPPIMVAGGDAIRTLTPRLLCAFMDGGVPIDVGDELLS